LPNRTIYYSRSAIKINRSFQSVITDKGATLPFIAQSILAIDRTFSAPASNSHQSTL